MITGIDVTKIEANRASKELISNMKFNINFDNVKVEKEDVNVTFTFTAVYDGPQGSGDVGKRTIVVNVA